jgi:hypothetical protein
MGYKFGPPPFWSETVTLEFLKREVYLNLSRESHCISTANCLSCKQPGTSMETLNAFCPDDVQTMSRHKDSVI